MMGLVLQTFGFSIELYYGEKKNLLTRNYVRKRKEEIKMKYKE